MEKGLLGHIVHHGFHIHLSFPSVTEEGLRYQYLTKIARRPVNQSSAPEALAALTSIL